MPDTNPPRATLEKLKNKKYTKGNKKRSGKSQKEKT